MVANSRAAATVKPLFHSPGLKRESGGTGALSRRAFSCVIRGSKAKPHTLQLQVRQDTRYEAYLVIRPFPSNSFQVRPVAHFSCHSRISEQQRKMRGKC